MQRDKRSCTPKTELNVFSTPRLLLFGPEQTARNVFILHADDDNMVAFVRGAINVTDVWARVAAQLNPGAMLEKRSQAMKGTVLKT